MNKENQMFFEQNFKGVNISSETIQNLLHYLYLCKCEEGELEILQCYFEKLDENSFKFSGLATIKGEEENRCIDGTIEMFQNKVVVTQEITRLYGKQLKTKISKTKDILINGDNYIYRKSIINGKEYVDKIKETNKNRLKY